MTGIEKITNSIEINKNLGISFEQYHFLMGLSGILLGALLVALIFGILTNLKV